MTETYTVELTREEISDLINVLLYANQRSHGARTCGAVDTAWTKLAKAVTDPEEWDRREAENKRREERQQRAQAAYAAKKDREVTEPVA